MVASRGDVYNDLLCYINTHLSPAQNDTVIEYCKGHYLRDEVENARNCLIDNYEELINKYDSTIISDLKNQRRNKGNRPATEIILAYICKTIIMLDRNGKRIDVCSTKANEIEMLNPEAVNEKTVLIRLKEFEGRLCNLEKENAELKSISLTDKEKIKRL